MNANLFGVIPVKWLQRKRQGSGGGGGGRNWNAQLTKVQMIRELGRKNSVI